jgi:hypothetical protein
MTRTRTVADLDTAVDDYRRGGYTILEQSATHAVVRKRDAGSLLTHLALFFTVGWVTLGVLNVLYALYRRSKYTDRVRLEAADA